MLFNRVLCAVLFACWFAVPVFAQTAVDCPQEIRVAAKCYNGQDANGSYYWIALPERWNGVLVMHAHGGPRLAPVSLKTSREDLARFSVTVNEGYAWAGSSYRRPGYGVRMAAEDTENLRKLFIGRFGAPTRTIFHGQSWGGNVAAKGIEIYGVNADGSHNYDAVLLTSGVIAGGTRAYLHRADLRAVYQYYCRNHPRSGEPQYPLWMGLPADSTMKRKELGERIDECTGLSRPRGERTAVQQRNLDDILAVIRVPERSLAGHMSWATFLFRDLVQLRLDGRNPFSNANVRYKGSSDDAALNAGVVRFDADPQGVAALAEDADMTGDIPVPVLSMHAIDDPVAMVEYETAYRETVARAGRQARLVQTFTDEHEHSKLGEPEYAALFEALIAWIQTGRRPTAQQIAGACEKHAMKYEGGCHFRPGYEPGALFSRVAPR